MADAAVPRASWRDAIAIYLTPTMAAMLALGFASGLPLMMVFQKLSFWLRESGIERSSIGYFYWVTLAYSLKVLWAPVVDRVTIPWLTRRLGRRRAWMLIAIGGTVVGLSLIAGSSPASSLGLTIAGALLLAYSGATLDIAIDAWRIESAPNEAQANMAATYSLGYRLAIMFSGLGLALAEIASWRAAFLTMAAAMAICGGLVWLIKEPAHDPRVAERARLPFLRRVADSVIDPFLQIAERLRWWIIPVLALVAIYRLSDFTMGVMASPLYADAGYSKATVGVIQSMIGPWITIVGGFLGGLAVARFGLLRALFMGAIFTLVTTAAYSILAFVSLADVKAVLLDLNQALPIGPSRTQTLAGLAAGLPPPPVGALFLSIGADNLSGGFVTTAFIAYMSSLTDRVNAATQYALFSSMYALFCKFAAGFSGVLTDLMGYQTFFLLCAFYAVPAGLLILLLGWRGSASARGVHTPGAEGRAAAAG